MLKHPLVKQMRKLTTGRGVAGPKHEAEAAEFWAAIVLLRESPSETKEQTLERLIEQSLYLGSRDKAALIDSLNFRGDDSGGRELRQRHPEAAQLGGRQLSRIVREGCVTFAVECLVPPDRPEAADTGPGTRLLTLDVNVLVESKGMAPSVILETRSVEPTTTFAGHWRGTSGYTDGRRPVVRHLGPGRYRELPSGPDHIAHEVAFDDATTWPVSFHLLRDYSGAEDATEPFGYYRCQFLRNPQAVSVGVKLAEAPAAAWWIECARLGDWPRLPDHAQRVDVIDNHGSFWLYRRVPRPASHVHQGLAWFWSETNYIGGVLTW